MLTTRQISIISYLISKGEWVTSDELSSHFDVNKKTIQLEIKGITEILGNKCSILSSHHSGYSLEYLSEDAQNLIRDEVSRHGGRNSLGIKPSALALYFLFLDSYVTMQTLADTFYMSKTAVSIELYTVKRWVDRYEGIEMEVSNKNGIKLHADELRKRLYCSKFGTIRVFQSLPLEKNVVNDYESYLSIVGQILINVFSRFEYYVTGEEYHKNCRFIATCILRSRMGYRRFTEQEKFEHSPLILSIGEQVCQRIGYDLEKAELDDIQSMLDESSVLYLDSLHYPDIENKLGLMENEICSILNISNVPIFNDNGMVIQQILKMYSRSKAGNTALNHYNEDIIIQYPLEFYLIFRTFPRYFNMKVTNETSFVALSLAVGLNSYRDNVSILLISNQNLSIINQIETAIYQTIPGNISEIKVLPAYLFEHDPDIRLKYDILLTTDQEVLFIDRTFYVINCILGQKDIENLIVAFLKRKNHLLDKKKRKIKEKYLVKEAVNQKQNNYSSVDQVIGYAQDGTLSYHTLGGESLYIGQISSQVKTGIKVYSMDFTVDYLHKKIRKIIFAQFHSGEEDVFDFFSAVSEVIKENV
jgi:lichenan operon transcriptional antiterminator